MKLDRLLLFVLQAADPAIFATLEGWADRQALLVCELHHRAQQVVNADGVQENLNRYTGVLQTVFVAFMASTSVVLDALNQCAGMASNHSSSSSS